MIRLATLATGCALLLAGLGTQPLYAHGFGERYDLPVPLWLYIFGAGSAVALSFAVIGQFLRRAPTRHDYPKLNLLRWRIGRAIVHPTIVLPARGIAMVLFIVVTFAGLFGNASENIAPTMVWVIWWVGLAYISALIGNLWTVINPWSTTFDLANWLYRRANPAGELSLKSPYPDQLGIWPGVLLFFAFTWVEIAYSDSPFPSRIAQMILIYSLITWGGMFLYGKDQWIQRGEAFSLAFGFLAKFAPTEIRVTSEETCKVCSVLCQDLDGQCIGCASCFNTTPAEHRELNLRPYGVGLLRNEDISTSTLAFIVLLLSTVTFDGFTETPLWSDIQITLYRSVPSITAIDTAGLLAFPLLFLGIYLTFAKLMAETSGRRQRGAEMVFARLFVHSLIPIALAYHLAHYLSFLFIQGQYIIPQASDPFGWGWDLMGTANYDVNIGIINAKFAWFTAVIAIVVGHAVAVYVAHVIALRVLRERGKALLSQIPMLALMVSYTMVSLWIVAQPII